MITDKQAEEIKRAVEGGTRGPILLKWIVILLADRAERVAQGKQGSAQPSGDPLSAPRA
jgi:hypothetical protein